MYKKKLSHECALHWSISPSILLEINAVSTLVPFYFSSLSLIRSLNTVFCYSELKC